jgi:hypothetical protein
VGVERGTDRELEAVRERWAAMERERALADRLVYGAALLGAGALLLVLSVPAEACVHGGGVAGAVCTAIEGPAAVERALVVAGAAALVAGSWLCWGVVGRRGRQRPVMLGLR